jgi:hypothetical protein
MTCAQGIAAGRVVWYTNAARLLVNYTLWTCRLRPRAACSFLIPVRQAIELKLCQINLPASGVNGDLPSLRHKKYLSDVPEQALLYCHDQNRA